MVSPTRKTNRRGSRFPLWPLLRRTALTSLHQPAQKQNQTDDHYDTYGKIGDSVNITNLWGTLHYRVVETKIIQPNDIDAIKIQPGRDLITLLTCHPYASGGKQRFLVICERMEEANGR
jgi:sortase family protein